MNVEELEEKLLREYGHAQMKFEVVSVSAPNEFSRKPNRSFRKFISSAVWFSSLNGFADVRKQTPAKV